MAKAGSIEGEERAETDSELEVPEGFDRDSRVLFFKNVEGVDTIYPFNLAKSSWEPAVQPTAAGPQKFIELMEATALQFGDIGLTGGSARGGISGERTFLVVRRSMKVESMPGMLQGRYFHAAVELHGELYAIAGLNGKGRMNCCERFKYIPEPDCVEGPGRAWHSIASLNITRSKLCACALNCKTIYVFGGEQFPSLERYSVTRNEWELLPPVSEIDPSLILGTIGLHRGGDEQLIILGRFFAFSYNTKTRNAQRQEVDTSGSNSLSLEKSAQSGDNIFVFTKNQPQLCLTIRTQPFRVEGRTSSLNTQYGVGLTTNVCAVSCLD